MAAHKVGTGRGKLLIRRQLLLHGDLLIDATLIHSFEAKVGKITFVDTINLRPLARAL